MKLRKVLATKNRCYIANKKMKPTGILVHSTGANNPTLRRYVAPDDGELGTPSSEHWNQSKTAVCVHAFIGYLKNNKDIATYQILPFDVCCWGCGSGPKGSYNASHIQFEICEDDLKSETYFNKVYKEAVEFCAYLCQTYGIKVSSITTHCDAHKAGYASNHGDVMHWFPKYGKNMDIFRSDVQKLLNGGKVETPKEDKPKTSLKVGQYRIDSADGMNIRKGAGTNYDKVGVVTKGKVVNITEFKGDWGKMDKGWINCNKMYCTRVGDLPKAKEPTKTPTSSFIVRVKVDSLNIRKGVGTSYDKVGAITDKGSYTIVETKNGWGKLKSGGWINISDKYVTRV